MVNGKLPIGLTERDAQNAVVDRLIEETVAGTSAALGPAASAAQ